VTGPEPGDQRPEPWQPDEHVGDVYEVEVGSDSSIERAEQLTDPPRIWVGSWLDYNNGILYGQWIDAARDEQELHADLAAMLASSPTTHTTGQPAEDWGIFDHDNFGSLRIGEQESLSWISAVARGIAEHGPAFAAYADVVEEEAALNGFEDDYLGHYASAADYATQMVEDLGYDELLAHAVPDSLRAYVRIDTDALARDLELSGDLHVLRADDGGVWLFAARSIHETADGSDVGRSIRMNKDVLTRIPL
jgi:antirestriction protein